MGGDTIVPVTLFDASKTSAAFRCSFATEAGRSYTVQFSDALFSAPWQVLTNVSGTGADALVADPSTGALRFYRVRTP